MLERLLAARKKHAFLQSEVFTKAPTPLLFSTDEKSFAKSLQHFLEKHEVASVDDTYEDQLVELFYLRNPNFSEDDAAGKTKLAQFLRERKHGKDSFLYEGVWVYYPWTRRLVHFLTPSEHQEIRTARNKYLLTPEEQEKFRKCVVGIGGMSIGNSVTLTLAYSGGCETMKLADPDVFSASNLNRVRFPAFYIGVKKVYVAAQQVYEVNPFAKLTLFPEGINGDNLEAFLDGGNPVDILIDELDNVKMKILLRLAARAKKLPLLMTTDNGDNVLLDIDRFDLSDDIPPYNQFPKMALPELVQMLKLDKPVSLKAAERVRLASTVVGPDKIATRMQHSLMEVGKTIASWPQLATAAFMGGAVVTYAVKKLALSEELHSGKLDLSLDGLLLKNYHTDKMAQHRKQKTEEFEHYLETLSPITLQDLLK